MTDIDVPAMKRRLVDLVGPVVVGAWTYEQVGAAAYALHEADLDYVQVGWAESTAGGNVNRLVAVSHPVSVGARAVYVRRQAPGAANSPEDEETVPTLFAQ